MTSYPSDIGQFVIGLSPIGGSALPVQQPLQTQIPAYPYWQYADDDDIQALFEAYNQAAQYYMDWFNTTPLAVYTNPNVSGFLLDWVAQGLYGMVRPLLGSGFSRRIGAIDTYAINQLAIDATKVISGGTFQTATDDIFKRIMTWNFYKGDGLMFSTTWLKRRVMRFLTGVGGLDGLDGHGVHETYGISVNTASAGSGFGQFVFGQSAFGGSPNALVISITNPLDYNPNVMLALQESVNSGVLTLPFQLQFTVVY